MSHPTQAMHDVDRPKDRDTAPNVAPLWTDVVLDADAIQAQRLALLAELTVEHFHVAYTRRTNKGNPTSRAAAQQLEKAAGLARKAAEQERSRCKTRSFSRSNTPAAYERDLA